MKYEDLKGNNMKNYISEKLFSLAEKIKVSAAMPGHKGKIDISGTSDMTELPGLDNLSSPSGIIMESQKMAAEVYGVHSAFYLVNGSTGGILTMIYSLLSEGDKVLVERNCHKSVYSAVALRKLETVYLTESTQKNPADIDEIKEKIEENPGIRAVILTSPTYYGYTADLLSIYDFLKEKGILLLVDGAHGAHLKGFPEYEDIYKNCDAMVLSLHKTLPALNQTALLLAGSEEISVSLKENIPYFQTSSPSYVLLKSSEEALGILEKGNLRRIREEIAGKTGKTGNIEIWGEDPWKVILSSERGGERLYDYLVSKGIYPEMHMGRDVLLMLSSSNTEEEINYLVSAIKEIEKESEYLSQKGTIPEEKAEVLPVKSMEIWEALGKESQIIDLHSGCGKTVRDYIIPYPPGIPLLVPGEVMDEEIIRLLDEYISRGREIIGINDGKVRFIV